MLTELSSNIPRFICYICETKTNNKRDYEKHLLTSKHKMLTSVNKMETDISPKTDNYNDFTCQNCNKPYKSRVCLWTQKKTCITEIVSENITLEKVEQKDKQMDLILMLVK